MVSQQGQTNKTAAEKKNEMWTIYLCHSQRPTRRMRNVLGRSRCCRSPRKCGAICVLRVREFLNIWVLEFLSGIHSSSSCGNISIAHRGMNGELFWWRCHHRSRKLRQQPLYPSAGPHFGAFNALCAGADLLYGAAPHRASPNAP